MCCVVITVVKSSGFVTLAVIAALVFVPLTGITGNSFHNIFSYAQTTDTTAKHGSLNNTFHSAFDTFVVPGSVNGYGIYQSHNSSIFKPGEKIVLYMEPIGYSYKLIGSLFLMNFTGDVLISDKAGHVLTGFQNLPLSTLISHYKNKELTLTVSLTQTKPFPPGEYVLKYTIHDLPSGNSFDIIKNIRIAND
jgi:hypothetical protein